MYEYVVYTQYYRPDEAILWVHSTYYYLIEIRKDVFEFASWSGLVIDPQWLELSIVPTIFESLKFDYILKL